jgi:hypothetical protein
MDQNEVNSSYRMSPIERSKDYSKDQDRIIDRSIMLRGREAEASIKENKPFRDIYSYLDKQIENHDKPSIKMHVHRKLMMKDVSTPSSLLKVRFYGEAMAQALQGRDQFELEQGFRAKRCLDKEQIPHMEESPGKRTPVNTTFSNMSTDYQDGNLQSGERGDCNATESGHDANQYCLVDGIELQPSPSSLQRFVTDLEEKADNSFFNSNIPLFKKTSKSIDSGQQQDDRLQNLRLEESFGLLLSDHLGERAKPALNEPYDFDQDSFTAQFERCWI